ncbi:MAG TPA: ATP-binding protein, partial [Dehalococcoidia bacterium]|nr:ATP-binding protein [Dehalococcoidia bacterium]
NPLTGITGFAQLLLQQDLPDEARRMVTTISDEAERASRIVQNLLSFARRRRPEKERVDLNQLIERVIELRSYELRVHNIEPHVRLAPDLAPVLADPHQIQQVLLNVIRNAEHAVQEHGGGTISCATSNIGNWARMVIADDGAGIRPENLRRIFDPFFTTKQVGEGTGLGLTISYGIIEEHGGRIDVDSQLGRGTTVKIDLPAAPDAPETAVSVNGGVVRPAPKRSILVIDDEPSIRDLLTATLLNDGHEVESAADGAAGLERLATRDFDLIITDVKMPGVDGIEFYRRVRAWDERVAARIIFTTGDMVSTATRDFLEGTGNPYLLKPFRLPDVKALVAQMLAR